MIFPFFLGGGDQKRKRDRKKKMSITQADIIRAEKKFEQIYALTTQQNPLLALSESTKIFDEVQLNKSKLSFRCVIIYLKIYNQFAVLDFEFRTTRNVIRILNASLQLISNARNELKLTDAEKETLLTHEKITVCVLIGHQVALCDYNEAIKTFKRFQFAFTNFGEHIGIAPHVQLGGGIILAMQRALNLSQAQETTLEFLRAILIPMREENMKRIPTPHRGMVHAELVEAYQSFRSCLVETDSLSPGSFINTKSKLYSFLQSTSKPLRLRYNPRGRIQQADTSLPEVIDAIKTLDTRVPGNKVPQLSVSSYWYHLAETMFICNNIPQALSYVEEATKLIKQFIQETDTMIMEPILLKAECFIILGKKTEAASICVDVIQSQPEKGGALLSLLRATNILAEVASTDIEKTLVQETTTKLIEIYAANPQLMSPLIIQSLKDQVEKQKDNVNVE